MADVHDHHAARVEPIAGKLEELARRQVERDVRLAVDVDHDHVVAARRSGAGTGARPRGAPRRRGLRRSNQLAAQPRQLRVDLDCRRRSCPGSSARARAPSCRPRCRGSRPTAAARARAANGSTQELVPVVAGQVGAGPVEASGRPGPRSARACDRRRAPRRRARTGTCVSTSSSTFCRRRRLDRADRKGEQQQDRRRNRAPRAGGGTRPRRRRRRRARRRGRCGAFRAAGISSSADSPGPDQAPDRRDRVHAARDGAALLDPLDGQPDRVRRGGAEQHHAAAPRARDTATSDPKKAPAETSSSASTETSRNGSATNGISPTASAATSTSVQRPLLCGWRSAKLPADPVPDRQRDEHDADRVRPHDRRGAEERRHQPRGRDLGAERRRRRPRTRAGRVAEVRAWKLSASLGRSHPIPT